MTKIQLTLTKPEASILQTKADVFGYDLSRYVKFLISKAVEQSILSDVPTFKASAKLEKRVAEAMEEYNAGRSFELKSLDDLDKYV
ncbi:hypothetical protein COV25_01690 [candidate division WWE3 bacterium CG10_big_fil_rev_8_21_14_0_10_35_32]|nr:MAG: hypothetical protein COV25_01690 [candidate division WWE3 bacterium CG10_big_fil_rev_8_21_14_0_10_35_32]